MSTKTKKFEFKINATPHLKMAEITKGMFNRNFHADVQFNVEGKIMYAHSLELIKRSEVFEQQLEDKMGVTKLIPVNDCKYESFYQFIRFIYTDECDIDDDNLIEILKLAFKYKVIILQNQVLSHWIKNPYILFMWTTPNWVLELFDHSVRDQNDITRNFSVEVAKNKFSSLLLDEKFNSIHPDTLEELLSFDFVQYRVTELQIFTALADWITSYCNLHKITLSEGRQRFDNLLRKIRFPTMTNEEIRECSRKYPGILSESDCMSIAHQTIFGGSGSKSDAWISKRREKYIEPYDFLLFEKNQTFVSIITVSNETILRGLRIGSTQMETRIEIEITETNDKNSVAQKLTFDVSNNNWLKTLIINLGESLRLKPLFQYTINIKYWDEYNDKLVVDHSRICCQNKSTDLIVNDPGRTVRIIQSSVNMIEMFFKPVTD